MLSGGKVKEIRTKLGLSQAEMAEKIGVSLRTIANYESGGVVPASKQKILDRLLEFHDVTRNLSDLTKQVNRTNKAVPFYANLPVSGGSADIALYNDDEEITGYIELPGFWGEGAFMVQGSSMSPEINNGDIISVSERITSLDSLNTERIYFIVTSDGERMIKRVYEDEEDKTKLVCFSPNFKPFRIDKESIIQIRRVVGHIRRL